MVGVINPPSSGGDIKAFADASKSVTINKPSSNGPDGGIVVAPGSSASGSASGSASASASASGSRTAVLTGSTTSGTGATGTGTVQASPTSTGAAAAVTEAAGLIIPALFAAVGLIL
ncbi:MAG: hypothetical protein M1839_007693 [Geoglossum umbratile]|nr:MAG: hypothetical protein M1839_007693 [Geoglossum umbratile]